MATRTLIAYIWCDEDITVEVSDAQGRVVLVTIATPVGRIEVMGEVSLRGRLLVIERTHIQGLRPGALGRAGLNAIARKLMVETDVDGIVVEGSTRTTGRTRGRTKGRSGSPIRLRLTMVDDVDRPVDVMRLLADHGLGLRRAHALFQLIARGEVVAAEVWIEGPAAPLIFAFAGLGIEARELRVPDVNTRDIRARLNLSQRDFALRFGFEIDTVQNWDQGRNQPDAATRVLLAIIERDPAIVEAVLTQPRASA